VNTSRGRVKAKPYNAWIATAGWQLGQGRAPSVPVVIAIDVGKCNIQRDLDNMGKPIIDRLVDLGWIKDDSVQHVVRVVISYLPDIVEAGKVRVTVTSRSV
jgi:Holliday junction resolvase RusA-like endonuclease